MKIKFRWDEEYIRYWRISEPLHRTVTKHFPWTWDKGQLEKIMKLLKELCDEV